jgi:NAD(P)-dependent dehydrogenase (short-subunit alcohol dehydrogenase family)
VNVTSDAAWTDPPAAPGAGGWGLGYAISKGALHRVAGVLAHEVAGTGVAVVNLSPGFVATERMVIDMAEFGFDASAGAPPERIGAVVAWLATSGTAGEWNGRTLEAQPLAAELGLT